MGEFRFFFAFSPKKHRGVLDKRSNTAIITVTLKVRNITSPSLLAFCPRCGDFFSADLKRSKKMNKTRLFGSIFAAAVLAVFLLACSNPAGPGGNQTQNRQTPPTDGFTPVPPQFVTVVEQLEWIRDYATDGTYVVWARADEAIPAVAAGIIGSNIGSANITVRIRSYGQTTPPPRRELTLTGGPGSMLTVEAGHTLYLYDIILTGNSANNASLVTVTGGNLIMQNAVIRDNYAVRGGGVSVYNGTFTMNNSAVIHGNTTTVSSHSGSGGGVFLSSSTLTMNSGAVIHSNQALPLTISPSTYGGGVHAVNSIVNMKGSSLIGGTAGQGNSSGLAGGVFLHASQLNMYNDAAIIGNQTSYKGGGVYVWQSSIMRMRGPNVRVNNNQAGIQSGGIGFSVGSNRLYIYNGEIYGNTAPTNAALHIQNGTAAHGRWDNPNPGWNGVGTIGSTASNIRVENGIRTL